MASVELTITGMLYDKLARTTQNVVLIGEASLTGVGIGGGPIQPPAGGQPPGGPVHIWGPPDMPPGFWGGGMGPGVKPQPPSDAHPEHPIYFPPQLPPSIPQPPPPGTVTGVPGNWPVQPIAVPPYAVFNYPGYGPVIVTPPAAPPAAGGGQPPGGAPGGPGNLPPFPSHPDAGIPHPQPV